MQVRLAAGSLGLFAALLVAMSWRRWGYPLSDPGLDLAVAAGWLDGIEPYRDVRYFYGPLGIAGLSATFAVLGTSLTSAWIYGMAQTVAIAELTRRLARRWVDPVTALATTAAVLAIGFSGSLFNFQLPHTEAASMGTLVLLAFLVALTGERWAVAGALLGALALTRPEFLAFGIAGAAGAAFGVWREAGFAAALRRAATLAPGALLVAGPVLAWFAHRAGAASLFTENLFPVDFVRTVGGRFEEGWHPYDLPSFGTLVLRGAIVLAGVRLLMQVRVGAGVLRPLAAAATLVVAAMAVAVLTGLLVGAPGAAVSPVVDDARRLLLPMTVLPAVALAMALIAARAWLRRSEAPLGSGWVADGALIAVAAVCTLRAYHAFSTDVYATYYAPPAVVLAAVLLRRALPAQPAAPGWRRALAPSTVLALAAAVLAFHAWGGRYRDFGVPVETPRGTFKALSAAGPNAQGVIDLLRPQVRPGDTLLVLPQEPGFGFLLGARPALYNATFLPGTLATPEADAQAARELTDGAPGRPAPRFVIKAARRFDAWGFQASGVDVNVRLERALRERYRLVRAFGDVTRPPASDEPAVAYAVYERLGAVQGRDGATRASEPAPPLR